VEELFRPSLVFEIAIALTEQSIETGSSTWSTALGTAVSRQRRYFDAAIPEAVDESSQAFAKLVAQRLLAMFGTVGREGLDPIVAKPKIPGFDWIDSGEGDFEIGSTIIEVKCTAKPFSANDLRQILVYGLLREIDTLERGGRRWEHAILLNPRRGTMLQVSMNELCTLSSGDSEICSVIQRFRQAVSSCWQP
jgi:hypothetical protein